MVERMEEEGESMRNLVNLQVKQASIFDEGYMAQDSKEFTDLTKTRSLLESERLISVKEKEKSSQYGIKSSEDEQNMEHHTDDNDKVSKSVLTKSYAGFDTGAENAVGCFFASMRTKSERDKAQKARRKRSQHPLDQDHLRLHETSQKKANDSEKYEIDQEIPKQYNSKEYVAKLIKQQEQRYQKKFAFERSQFHQSIPNPMVENQMITVQLVKRVLQVRESKPHEEFPEEQEEVNISQQYQRFKFQTPNAYAGEDEGEDETTDNETDRDNAFDITKIVTDQVVKAAAKQAEVTEAQRAARRTSRLETNQSKLYLNNNLNETINEVLGVSPEHYANVVEDSNYKDGFNAMTECENYAVIGFWDLKKVSDTFKCVRFFVMPDPYMRMISKCDDTELYQILYSSQHSKDVFLFFEGYNQNLSLDLDDGTKRTKEMQCAILRLNEGGNASSVLENRHLRNHCQHFFVIDKSSYLGEFINYLSLTDYSEQDQLPNPTLIDLEGKKVVFTSYDYKRQQKKTECKSEKSSSYPTIYFHDFDKDAVDWQIDGAEIFVGIDTHKNVMIVRNEIWEEISQETYKAKNILGFSRHQDYDNHFMKLRYRAGVNTSEPDDSKAMVKSIPAFSSSKLTFGSNLKLDITKDVKIVEAYEHNSDRLTLVYKGLGSYTFILRPAQSLIDPNRWYIQYGQHKCEVKLSMEKLNQKMHKLSGEGKDENKQDVSVTVYLAPDDALFWSGYYEEDKDTHILDLESLQFYDAHSFGGQWTDENTEQRFSIQKGQIKGGNRRKPFDISFILIAESTTRGPNSKTAMSKYFKGTLDQSGLSMKGTWSYEKNSIHGQRFAFNLCSRIVGVMKLKFEGENEESAQCYIDFKSMELAKTMTKSEDLVQFYAVDAVDTAELCYFILQSDVNFLTTGSGDSEQAYIQAKLKATSGTQDVNSNGLGIALSSINLYNISAELAKPSKKDQNNTKLVVREPNERQQIEFCLNQSFLRVQEKMDIQLWHVCPSFISSDNRFFGSVIFEDYSTDDLCLNFISASLNQKDDEERIERDYPQQPLSQTWIVDYPLLAYKTCTPMNKEIAIVHMAQNMPQRIIHLGEWEFVSFVNHTQMVEQKLFDQNKETNCDIMFLARRDEKIRLMSFKSNPWLKFDEDGSGEDVEYEDPDIVKQAIFMFSGWIPYMPNEEEDQATKIDSQSAQNRKRFCRRFNNDKIQNAQLITNTKFKGSYRQYMMIIQFEDSIVMASLNQMGEQFEIICQPDAMVRRHMVRGYDEKIFYCESHRSAEKIFQLEFHSSKKDNIKKKEIWQLAGSQLVAFEVDGQCIVDDLNDDIKQSFFVMDDHQKIYLVQNNDNIRFVVTKTIDFSHHKMLQEITALKATDWTHVHMTQRTMTVDQYTYNYANTQSVEVQVPQTYFGAANEPIEVEEEKVRDESQSDDEIEQTNDWEVQSIQAMSLTTNVIAQCQRKHKEFCFLVKPCPGSRKINIVGYQQLQQIENMLFASNNHVLCKFKGGKAVTLLSNGCILHQESRLQRKLDYNSTIVGESVIHDGRKVVLLEEKNVEFKSKKYNMIRFDQFGEAHDEGSFKDYKEQMDQQLKEFDRQIVEEEEGSCIKYARDFFVSPNGQVIKFAAIISHEDGVKDQLIEDVTQDLELEVHSPTKRSSSQSKAFEQKKKDKKKNIDKAEEKETFISVFKIHNNEKVSDSGKEDGMICDFKVIAFHCLDEAQQNKIVSGTQFCVVGNNICYRSKDKEVIWIMKFNGEKHNNILNDYWDLKDQYAGKRWLYPLSKSHSISKMVDRRDLKHIQMTEVPKAFYTTIKPRKGKEKISFYKDLLQITARSTAIHLNLDEEMPDEISQIENIDQLQDPDKVVNTGFIMSSSKDDMEDGKEFQQRTQNFTNEFCNLLFWRRIKRKKGQTKDEYEIQTMAMLYRTFSEIDLWQLDSMMKAIHKGKKINQIDPESIVCNYEGHTIFSIFFDRIQVYEQIMDQLKATEFEGEEDDQEDQDHENEYLRRLYRVLKLPTGDFKRYDSNPKKDRKLKRKELKQKEEEKESWTRKASIWIKDKIGICELPEGEHNGFKQITRKSLYFKSSRYPETLMEIAMMCQETSLSDFVGDLQDITVMLNSMSPAIQEFMNHSFIETRYTRKIENIDWKMDEQLLVFGKQQSTITQKDPELLKWMNDKKIDQGNLQNRQVEVQMLNITWIFASGCGFRELVAALANTPHESVFSTNLVMTLVKIFEDKYIAEIKLWCFIPYILYFVFTVVFYTVFTSGGIHNFSEGEQVIAGFIGFFIICLDCYFLFFEFVIMMRDGMTDYMTTDPFNYVDMLTAFLNFIIVFMTLTESKSHVMTTKEESNIRAITALTVFLMWIKSFYWLRFFTSYSKYVRLIKATLYDMRFFLTIFFFLLMAFGNALMILNEGRYQENMIVGEFFGLKFVDALMNQYMLALGEFDLDNFRLRSNDTMVWILFILSTFITQITFLNMLIAVMGDTYGQVKDTEKQSALKETIELMADYAVAVSRDSATEQQSLRFIFAVQPKALGDDEQGDLEGTVTHLKSFLQKAVDSIKGTIGRRMGNISEEVTQVTRRIGNLDDKMNEMHGVQQRASNSLSAIYDHQRRDGNGLVRQSTRSDIQDNNFGKNKADELRDKVNKMSVEMNERMASLEANQKQLLPSIQQSFKEAMRELLQENAAGPERAREQHQLPRASRYQQLNVIRESGVSSQWDFSNLDDEEEKL